MTLRDTILNAIGDSTLTSNEIQDLIGEPKPRRVVDNVKSAMMDGLIERIRDDITGLPAYRLSVKGKDRVSGNVSKPAQKTNTSAKRVENSTESAQNHAAEIELLAKANRIMQDRVDAETKRADAWQAVFTDLDLANTPEKAFEYLMQLRAEKRSSCKPSLGWMVGVPGHRYNTEAEARSAAESLITTDDAEQYGEAICVAQIIAIAEPVVAVKWEEAA